MENTMLSTFSLCLNIVMGGRIMRKGQKKRIWTPTQKLEIVKAHPDDHISVRTPEKEYGAEHETVCRWVEEYISGGEAPL